MVAFQVLKMGPQESEEESQKFKQRRITKKLKQTKNSKRSTSNLMKSMVIQMARTSSPHKTANIQKIQESSIKIPKIEGSHWKEGGR
jgi:hypothetical protein